MGGSKLVKSALINLVLLHVSAIPGMKTLSTSYWEWTVYFAARNRYFQKKG